MSRTYRAHTCTYGGNRTFRSSVFSLLGAKVPTDNFRSRERKFPGTFAPGIVSSHFFSDKYNLLIHTYIQMIYNAHNVKQND